MAITKFIAGLPQRTMTQEAFDAATAQLMGDLPVWAGQVNAIAAGINMVAAGGGLSIPYIYRTSGGLFVAGNGHFATDNNANQSAATQLYLDHTSLAAVGVQTLIAAMSASTSTVKGYLRLSKLSDPSKFIVFAVTARTDLGGYSQFNGTVTNSGGAANPFAVNDPLVAHFTPTGDVGPAFVQTYMKVSDRKVSGSGGGVSVSGYNIRALNTVETNTIVGASLASDTITLPAGTYEFWARAPAYNATQNQIALFNSTDGSYAVLGSSQNSGSAANTDSTLVCRITIAATKNYQLRHWFAGGSGTTATALGCNSTNPIAEVFAEIEIKKVA